MEEIIHLEQVIKMHPSGIRAVNDVSFCVQSKERVEILGASGSGKTTLMRLIAGMEPPSTGTIQVLGKAVHAMEEEERAEFRNRTFGIVRRESGLWDSLTVLENTALPLTLRGVSSAQRQRAARERLKSLGMDSAAFSYPKQLSPYEAQLVSIARAFTAQPKILLLDEIGANLTLKESEKIGGLLNTAVRQGDWTVVSFADAKAAWLNASKKWTLDHGKMEEEKL